MAQQNFSIENRSLRDLLGNGAYYRVPRYQRDYSWGEEQWSDLWDDLWNTHESEEDEVHYMGYLVLQRKANNEFVVIDGQQRLATFSIFILACLQELKKPGKNEEERIAAIHSQFVSNTDLSSLAQKYKLALNRNDDAYYRNQLASLAETPNTRNINRSQELMRKAKAFFGKKIAETGFDGEKLGAFIDKTSLKLVFTAIYVDDDLNAYNVFETLNARGARLSSPDLLKNYLFSVMDPKGENSPVIEAADERWGKIMGNMAPDADASKFVRAYWNGKNEMVDKTRLFKKIKQTITSAKEADAMLQELYESAPVYAALGNLQDNKWRDYKPETRNALYSLHVFGITQPLTLLLAAEQCLTKADFEGVCRLVSAFSVRYYPVCGRPLKDADRLFNKMAISARKGAGVGELKNMLKQTCPGDEEFIRKFGYKELPVGGGKKANFLLASIENKISPNNPLPLRNNYTVEHILPQKCDNDDYWREHFGGLLEQNVQRLGNMTLLAQKDNEKIANADFDQKKRVYAKSALSIVKKICEHDKWDATAVDDYQQWLAERAAEVWRI
jgi:hypothetical protein